MAADPYVVEVTEWDVPVWFVDVDDKFFPVSLIPYKDVDSTPKTGALGEEFKPITFVEPADIEHALSLKDTPGEIDLLDAWSLYYRGRRSDAIRSLVTSIEVLLEAKLREYLLKGGMSETEVQSRLDDSWSNFQARLSEYVRASGRRVPGPILSFIPYINGIRLREELEQVRRLRHKIVHEGERISYPFHGPIQRAMETMAWLFKWLAESPLPRKRRLEGDALKTSMRGVIYLQSEYTPSGVVVREFDGNAKEVETSEELLRSQLVAAIDKGSADIEKFALMVISKLGFNGLDTPAPETDSPFLFERLILRDGENFIPLFLCDSHEDIRREVIERIAARLLALKIQKQPVSLAMLVANSQNGLEWQYRDTARVVNDFASQMALQCGIAVVSTVDLLLRRVAAHCGGRHLAMCYSSDQHRENAYRGCTQFLCKLGQAQVLDAEGRSQIRA